MEHTTKRRQKNRIKTERQNFLHAKHSLKEAAFIVLLFWRIGVIKHSSVFTHFFSIRTYMLKNRLNTNQSALFLTPPDSSPFKARLILAFHFTS